MTAWEILEAARHCISGKGCCQKPICPMSQMDGSCVIRFAQYICGATQTGYVDLENFHETATHNDVTILTVDGANGFAWIDRKGIRHDEDGFVIPKLRVTKGIVQELVSSAGERSAAWRTENDNEV